MKAFLFCFCAVVMLTGCASRPPLKLETLATIHEREATQAQVEELLGTPDSRVTDSSRRTLTMYEDQQAKQRANEAVD